MHETARLGRRNSDCSSSFPSSSKVSILGLKGVNLKVSVRLLDLGGDVQTDADALTPFHHIQLYGLITVEEAAASPLRDHALRATVQGCHRSDQLCDLLKKTRGLASYSGQCQFKYMYCMLCGQRVLHALWALPKQRRVLHNSAT